MQNEPKIIDHNPDERRPTNGIWWGAWGVVALLWIGQIYLDGWSSIQWGQIALGGISFGILTLWSLEMKGDNEPPSWMIKRRKPRIRR